MPETRSQVADGSPASTPLATNGIPGPPVHSRILNLPCMVEIFKGDTAKVPVVTWLNQLKTYFENENITDFATQLSEAKRFTAEDGRLVICENNDIRAAKSWKEFEEAFLNLFSDQTRENPFAALRTLMKHKWKSSTESYCKFEADLSVLGRQLIRTAEREYDIQIPAQVVTFLEAGVIYMNLPEEAARRFENTYKKEVSITKCMAKVRKRFPKLEARSERIKMVNYSHDKEGMGRRESQEMRPKWASQRDTGDHGEVARDESGKVCYKCTKKGHFANQCKNRPYCNFCNIPGHSYRDCRKRKGQSRSYPEPGSGRQGMGKPSLHEKGSKKGQVKRVSANDPPSVPQEEFFLETTDTSEDED